MKFPNVFQRPFVLQINSLLLLFVTISFGVTAEPLFALSENQLKFNMNQGVVYIEDKESNLTIEQVKSLDKKQWSRNRTSQVNFGYSSSTFWLKAILINPSQKPLSKYLEISYSVLDYLDIFIVENDQIIRHERTGDKLPFSERAIENRNFLLDLSVAPNTPQTIYVKVRSSSSVQIPLTLWNPKEFHQAEQAILLFHGIYFGITFVMVLYNLFVYIALRERVYLLYIGFISCMSLFLASLNGIAFQYLWPEFPRWNEIALLAFLNGLVFFGALFTQVFLSLKKYGGPLLASTYRILATCSFILVCAAFVVPYEFLIRPSIYLAVISCAALLLVGMYRSYQGNIPARYFTIAWTTMLSGGIILALNKLTILPQNFFTEHATQIGAALEIILLSIALADRLNYEKRQTFRAQKQALRHERDARSAQDEIIKVQREANEVLEEEVKKRTAELEKANERLKQLSSTDPLTGLKNRGFFNDGFELCYASAFRHQRILSMLLIDVDHFKKFNDNHGHLVGDDCLIMVSDCIRDIISRPEDIVARYGGEEFVVLLPETDLEGAKRVAEKIRAKIERTPLLLDDMTLNVTVSIGIAAEIPHNIDGKTAFFDRADEALYQAKRLGRNQVC